MSDQRTIGRVDVKPDHEPQMVDHNNPAKARAHFVDHKAREVLSKSTMTINDWEDRLIQQAVIADLIAFIAAEALAWLLIGEKVREVLTVFGHPISYSLLSIVAIPAWIAVVAANRGYDRSIIGSSPDEYPNMIRAVFVSFTLICAASFMGGMPVSRALFAVFFPLLLLFSLLARLVVRKRLHHRRNQGHALRRVVLVSRASAIANVAEHFARTPHVGYQVVGAYLHVEADEDEADELNVALLGEPDDLIRDLDDLAIDAVALSGNDLFETESLRSLAWKLHDTGIQLLMAPDLAEIAGPRIISRPAAGLPLLLVEEPHTSGLAQFIKTLVERSIAAILYLFIAPILAVIALTIKLTSKGPVLFKQTRVGRDGSEFLMLKFRSMVADAEEMLDELVDENEHDGVLFKIKDDPRITPTGQFLRRYSLDELPQLWNVVRGDMSLVGPRPPLPSEVEKYEETTRRRLMVRPGITGLWQVSGRSDLSWDETVRLDLYYVENWSPLLDVIILAKTAKAVLRSDGAY